MQTRCHTAPQRCRHVRIPDTRNVVLSCPILPSGTPVINYRPAAGEPRNTKIGKWRSESRPLPGRGCDAGASAQHPGVWAAAARRGPRRPQQRLDFLRRLRRRHVCAQMRKKGRDSGLRLPAVDISFSALLKEPGCRTCTMNSLYTAAGAAFLQRIVPHWRAKCRITCMRASSSLSPPKRSPGSTFINDRMLSAPADEEAAPAACRSRHRMRWICHACSSWYALMHHANLELVSLTCH